jgi:hypothetical protein
MNWAMNCPCSMMAARPAAQSLQRTPRQRVRPPCMPAGEHEHAVIGAGFERPSPVWSSCSVARLERLLMARPPTLSGSGRRTATRSIADRSFKSDGWLRAVELPVGIETAMPHRLWTTSCPLHPLKTLEKPHKMPIPQRQLDGSTAHYCSDVLTALAG